VASKAPIRILLVDDHRVVREGLAALLATQPDLCVVGEAGTGREALDQVTRYQPDIMLLDLELPDLDGVGVLEGLQTVGPTGHAVRVIVLTAYGADERILDAVRAGARGYLLKGAGMAEVLHAIHVVAAGGALLAPGITERLLGSVGQMLRSGAVPAGLTVRERAILERMAQGLSNKAIGADLHLAERTVKFYATVIFQKLGVSNRAEAVATAVRDHLI
jgi:DNA-binding NarL/FixJ family response regulator